MDASSLNDLSLTPTPPRWLPGASYHSVTRTWQGIPGIELTPDGHLWATWYSGGSGEGPENYVLLVKSENGGQSWSQPLLVIDPASKVRAFDPCLWLDPRKRLWLFWAQSWELFDGRLGVFAMRCDEPTAVHPTWSAPQRLFDGVMMNKPLVLADGSWLAPAAVWSHRQPQWPELARERFSNVYASTDHGLTWVYRGGADVPQRNCDEHMLIQKHDGSLWMLVRTSYGIGQSFSHDQGRTWTPGEDSGIPGPTSRFFLRRLASGHLLLVNHVQFVGRSHLTASLSEDEGMSWPHHLLLDERKGVSYPDAVESDQGVIHVIYDRERHAAREILMARFTQQDLRNGRITSPEGGLRLLVNRAGHQTAQAASSM